jgi:RNA polymerase sigma-70 factor, ECF subfamily
MNPVTAPSRDQRADVADRVEPRRVEGSLAIQSQTEVRSPSFETVYDAHFDFVWRSLRRLGVEEASVDDAAQEVFVVVHRRLGDFEGRSSLKTWLYSIALHVARHHRRAMKRRLAPNVALGPAELEAVPDRRGQGPDEAAEAADGLKLLDHLLGQLDDEKLEAFVLAHIEQMAATEIAEVLGENLNTVYSRLRAARRDFEQALARHRARERWRNP